MTELEELAFLRLREQQARTLASESRDISVIRAHEAMAEGYAARVFALRGALK
jgi:hypothetical protein